MLMLMLLRHNFLPQTESQKQKNNNSNHQRNKIKCQKIVCQATERISAKNVVKNFPHDIAVPRSVPNATKSKSIRYMLSRTFRLGLHRENAYGRWSGRAHAPRTCIENKPNKNFVLFICSVFGSLTIIAVEQ